MTVEGAVVQIEETETGVIAARSDFSEATSADALSGTPNRSPTSVISENTSSNVSGSGW